MLVTVTQCRERMGVQTTAHDTHITSLIGAAQGICEAYIRQPLERTSATYYAPCVSLYDHPLCGIYIRPSIDVQVDAVVVDGVNITSQVTYDSERNRLLLPTDYEAALATLTLTSGWTPSTVPDVVVATLCELVAHLYRSTALADINTAGLSSLSYSQSGVVTESRTLRDDYVDLLLRRLDRWRRM
ncbi:MAG: hypothetical protein KatS3mg038_1162 [Candidatus Kapaibacterium sp.]|nr:MAG: hypothetical protein KatS3mg038_1162 [Candidatus Kapabacteria bacterium]